MSTQLNQFGQPIGFPVDGWKARPRPPRSAMQGRLCRVVPLDCERHADELFAAFAKTDARLWTYMAYGPFPTLEAYRAFLAAACCGEDPLVHTIIDERTSRAIGVASLMRIDPAMGTIEVGGIVFASELQRTPAATESMYLLMRRAFEELGYRRYEWKCDALNAPSRAAAVRLGFQFEGIFRQAVVYKGRNRDTAWFAIIDRDWPVLKDAFESWLAPENFDPDGTQRQRLSELTRKALAARG
jgi:RimJ/RimL family protein N-acetyltransferase